MNNIRMRRERICVEVSLVIDQVDYMSPDLDDDVYSTFQAESKLTLYL